jgi:hypothetical protein
MEICSDVTGGCRAREQEEIEAIDAKATEGSTHARDHLVVG